VILPGRVVAVQYPELVSERARATFVRAFETKSVEFKPCLVPPKKKQANSSSAPILNVWVGAVCLDRRVA